MLSACRLSYNRSRSICYHYMLLWVGLFYLFTLFRRVSTNKSLGRVILRIGMTDYGMVVWCYGTYIHTFVIVHAVFLVVGDWWWCMARREYIQIQYGTLNFLLFHTRAKQKVNPHQSFLLLMLRE
jgi:hypothetical protein